MSDAILGAPHQDLAVSNLHFSSELTQCSGQVKSQIISTCTIDALIGKFQDLTVDNLLVQNTLVTPSSFISLRSIGPFPGPSVVDVSDTTITNQINFLNSIKLGPLTTTNSVGNNLTQVGNDVQVLKDGVYNIYYRVFYRNYVNDGSLVPGKLGNYSVVITTQAAPMIGIVGVIINDTYNDTFDEIHAISQQAYQFVGNPFFSNHTTLYLQAGDLISLYSYFYQLSPGVNSNPTVEFVELNVSET